MFFKSVVLFVGSISLCVSISSLQALEEDSSGRTFQIARYRDLDRDQKENLVTKATQITKEKITADELGSNLCNLYLQEFGGNFHQFRKFLKSQHMVKFLSKHPDYRLEFSAVAVESSRLFWARTNVTQPIHESPFYTRLCAVFGDKRIPFQTALSELVDKALEKCDKKTRG